MRKLSAALPLVFALIMMAIFCAALLSGRDAKTIPSALINRPAPMFTAPAINGLDMDGLKTEDFKGEATQVTLLNVWASWCTPCIAEHPYITALSRNENLRLYGINYKDKPEAAQKFLSKLGNPYEKIGTDKDGTIAIDFGVYGVPETYLIDHKGIIRYKVVGPVTDEIIKNDLQPLIDKLTKAAD